jgi:hypothetical protein
MCALTGQSSLPSLESMKYCNTLVQPTSVAKMTLRKRTHAYNSTGFVLYDASLAATTWSPWPLCCNPPPPPPLLLPLFPYANTPLCLQFIHCRIPSMSPSSSYEDEISDSKQQVELVTVFTGTLRRCHVTGPSLFPMPYYPLQLDALLERALRHFGFQMHPVRYVLREDVVLSSRCFCLTFRSFI